MDVSIAVPLIRGQLGAVVERAVNGAVETVLAEMLRVVGGKFDELKSQVAVMKGDLVALHREKAVKEKESESLRARLRYTELKLKYYRQGVEEELQHRATHAHAQPGHAHTHTPPQPQQQQQQGALFTHAQRGAVGGGVSSKENSAAAHTGNNTECTSQHRPSRRVVGVHCQPDASLAGSHPSDPLLLPVSLSIHTPAEATDSSTVVFCPLGGDPVQTKPEQHHHHHNEWTVTLQGHTEGLEPATDPLREQTLTLTLDQQTNATVQVKQEPQQEEEEEEVICIKEEPEEEQEVMSSLLMDCQGHGGLCLPEPQAQRTGWSEVTTSKRDPATELLNAAGPSIYAPPPPPPPAPAPPLPRHSVPPWTKELSLYDEYKLRRSDLRRRNSSRRRELEKALPQPLITDMVRDRREKTRLRVAKWRAKRKLQACLNQTQAQGGAAVLSQTGFHQLAQQRVQCATSSIGRTESLSSASSYHFHNSTSNTLPFMTPTAAASSSSMTLRGSNSQSASSSYPQMGLSQHSLSLTDTDILQ